MATSSIGQAETVERQKGTPAFSAARTACVSPRRAARPARPIGASATGIDALKLQGRSVAEIAGWGAMSEAERLAVMAGLDSRLVSMRSRGARARRRGRAG